MKKFLAVLLIFVSLTEICGCVNSKQETENKINSMQAFAEDKYNKEFKYEYFVEAFDETYTNILSLSDGEVVFNVYKNEPEDVFYDDYNSATLNKKFIEYIKNENNFSNSNIEIYSHIMLVGRELYDYKYVTENTMDEIIEENEFMKIILIVKIDDIETSKQSIFELYNSVCNLSPEYIDFQIIDVSETNENLEKMLNNLPGHYSNDWDKYKEIEAYVSINEKDITTKEELFENVVKINL